jgi:hypothetical protein
MPVVTLKDLAKKGTATKTNARKPTTTSSKARSIADLPSSHHSQVNSSKTDIEGLDNSLAGVET